MATSILSDIIIAGKRLFSKAGEAVVDANAIAIIEQRIIDAEKELNESNEQLASLMAKRKVQKDTLDEKNLKLEEYGKYIKASMDKGNQDLAKETAIKYAEIENEMKVIQNTLNNYDNAINSIKERNKVAEDVIKQSTNRIEMLKAQEAMIDASSAISDAHSGAESSLSKALESAERLEKSQKERIAQIDAAAELQADKTGASLEKKLEEAGIISTSVSADDILKRFSNQS